jgi:phthalate 4,5-dioxygenase oxygenase subunit
MLHADRNEKLTKVSNSNPGGRLLRCYWQPAALVDELSHERPVVPVTLLGERLVLFRNEGGELRLMNRHCPHRGADLCYGRLEDGGIRCPFHGWLFDGTGKCLERPAQPNGDDSHKRLKLPAYPVREKGGIVWAYLGEGQTPAFPEFDCFVAPQSHVFAFKGLWRCNWLQALEVGIDPAHASFLHRFFEDESVEDSYGKQFRAAAGDTEIPLTKILRDFHRPEILIDDTDYGLRITTTRDLGEEKTHFRITNLIFPNAITIPMSNDMTITQWHVPIDNENCYWYSIFTSFDEPVDHDLMRNQRLEMHTLPDYHSAFSQDNAWGFDPNEQKLKTYTGMGMDINIHDQWAVESLGKIQDRTKEHLVSTDIAINHNRRLLFSNMDKLEQGERPDFVLTSNAATSTLRGPITIDVIAASIEKYSGWIERDKKRREAASWAAPNPWEFIKEPNDE